MVGIGVLPLWLSKWVPNLSAALKVIVLVGLGVVGVAFAIKHGTRQLVLALPVEADLGRQLVVPADHHLLVHGLRAHELGRRRHQEPRRDIPKMIILAGVAILASTSSPPSASFGVKLADINIVTGIADALKVSFDKVLGTSGREGSTTSSSSRCCSRSSATW